MILASNPCPFKLSMLQRYAQLLASEFGCDGWMIIAEQLRAVDAFVRLQRLEIGDRRLGVIRRAIRAEQARQGGRAAHG